MTDPATQQVLDAALTEDTLDAIAIDYLPKQYQIDDALAIVQMAYAPPSSSEEKLAVARALGRVLRLQGRLSRARRLVVHLGMRLVRWSMGPL